MPGIVYPSPRGTYTSRGQRGRKGPNRGARFLAVVVVVLALIATGAVWTNAFGAGERFDHLLDRVRLAVNPPPDRVIAQTVEVTDPPLSTPPAIAIASPGATDVPGAEPTEAATSTPLPPRKAVNVKLALNPDRIFQKELTDKWCAPAGTQMVLAMFGKADNSEAFQRHLDAQVGQWESRRDSHTGGWGPAAISAALDTYGVPGYEVRAYASRNGALRGAAAAIEATNAPVVMMAWRGAHTWIITGFKADADPQVFPDASITGLYIYDPWFGWISSIWEPSLPPGGFHDFPNLQRNFLPWDRPDGSYPDRDGKFILVVPTQPRSRA